MWILTPYRQNRRNKECRMAKKTIRRKTVLSESNQKLLEELCTEFGSQKEARRDPEVVLHALLQVLNEDKGDVSAMLRLTLKSGIRPGALERKREVLEHPEGLLVQ
jgi:hypothetical protein